MRKRVSFIFTICFVTLFSISLLFDIAVFAETSGYYTYTVSSGNATITDVSPSLKGSVTIPGTLDGYPVTGIGVGAFSNAYQMTSVTIPKSVKSIDSNAFASCYNLTSISVDANNQFFSSFGGVLFDKNKTKLLRCPPGKYLSTYEVPESVTTIGDDAFFRCHIYEVVLSDNVVSIGEFAFSDCIYLDNIFISNKLKTIGYHAFGVLVEEEAKRSLTVYYQGSKHEMLEINIDRGNEFLLKSNWFYNQCKINSKHSFSNINDKSCDVCNYVKVDWCHSYTINDNHTCDICGYSKAPSAPIVEKITNNSVTLKPYSYLEYSKDGVNWQNENVFEGLSSETEYIFYQRVKPTDDSASESSLGTELTTKKLFHVYFDANGGISAPEAKEKVEDIPMNIPLQTPTRNGYVFAGWGSLKKCGKQYDPGDEYSVDEDITFYALWYELDECTTCLGIGTIKQNCSACDGSGYYYDRYCSKCGSYNITQHITGSGSLGYMCNNCLSWSTSTIRKSCVPCDGAGKRNVTCGICNGFGGTAIKQDSPVIISYTDTTATLILEDNCEYSKDGITWQESNVFINLSPGIKYTFYKRIRATDTSPFSAMSLGVSVTTDKSKQTLIPNAPTVQSFTSNSIILNVVDGCEYSKDGFTWQSSNVFSNLSCGTEYTFYQRYKETTSTYVGKNSEALVAKTDKGTQTKPSAPTLSSKSYNSVTLTAISGYEYSRDGVNWQTNNVFDGLSSETNYIFYQRKAETSTYYASDPSSSLIVKTYEQPDYTLYDYTIEFKDWNGTVLSTGIYKWGDVVTVPNNPTRATDHIGTYSFAGWDKDVVACAGNATYTATYTVDYKDYTIVFKDWNGTVLSTKSYHYGDKVTVPTTPTKTSNSTYTYTFAGWDKTVVNCAGNATYTAIFTPVYINYTITFKNWDGSVLATNTYHYGDVVELPKEPTKEKDGYYIYTFAGWNKAVVPCVGNAEYTATFNTEHYHTYKTSVINPTCTNKGYTKYSCVCGNTYNDKYVNSLGHTYSNNCDKSCNACSATRSVSAHKYTNNCDTTCNYCNAKRTIKHTYSNNCDTSCNVCKTTRTITHAYKTTTTRATLAKNGSIVKKCTVCGKVASNTAIKYAKTFKLSTTSYTYNGKVKTPSITVKDSASKTLKKNTDYTVTYASGRKNVGTYKVTIKGKGNYSFTKTLTFKINPAKTTVSKLTAGKKSITVAITKKSTQVTGYQIQYSTSKSFSKATTKTISSYKTTKYTLKSLSAKKTYYVRVRTYKTVGKTKYYSGWSTYKYVKTK